MLMSLVWCVLLVSSQRARRRIPARISNASSFLLENVDVFPLLAMTSAPDANLIKVQGVQSPIL